VYCFFAHHRSASSSTNDILRELSRYCGWRHVTVHNPAAYGHDLAEFCAWRRPGLLTFSNASADQLADLPDYRGVHLVRDPRDVLVSSYFSHRDSHPVAQWPELRVHREELRLLDKEQGLLLEMDCRAPQFAELDSWQYRNPRVLEWKMEDLIQDPRGHFMELMDFWGIGSSGRVGIRERLRPQYNRLAAAAERRLAIPRLPRWQARRVSAQQLEAVLAKHSFQQKSRGRSPGVSDAGHHYRAGMPGDWRQHFSATVTQRFKERFGALLVKLGYERGFDW